MALHYTGREYDQLNTQLRRMVVERKVLKQDIISKLTEALQNQEAEVLTKTISLIDEIFTRR